MKKIPQRMCVVCRERKGKSELIRIVYNAEKEISVDLTGKKPGRGAYICRKKECLEQAVKSNRLERGLHAKVEKEVFDSLWAQIPSSEGKSTDNPT